MQLKKEFNQYWDKLKYDLGSVITDALLDPKVVEIMLNEDGGLWIERHGSEPEYVCDMEPSKAYMIICSVAASVNAVVNAENPDIGTELPVDGSRFQGVIYPSVENPIFTIRKRANVVYSFDDYVDQKIMTKNQAQVIKKLVKERKNVLIVGGTGTGKTTLANAYLKEVSICDPTSRVVIIEDTKELQCESKNKTCLKTSKTRNMFDLLRVTMRLRPSRICVGEVRGAEAFSLISAWNTGHGGGVATVHANSAEAGVKRLANLFTLNNYAPVKSLIAEAINAIVSIQKTNEGRRIEEILELDCENEEYIFKNVA